MTKTVKIRNIYIGGGNPVAIQSMTNLSVEKIDETLAQINALKRAGCDIVRVAVPNEKSLSAFSEIRKRTNMPLVADIHFDYRLAVGALKAGADKIRINPGNIPKDKLDVIIDCAKDCGAAIRIGVNGGSTSREYLKESGFEKSRALMESLKGYLEIFLKRNFDRIVLSLKSSDVRETVALNREAAKLGFPLHLGVTEAGLLKQGLIKNAIGIGSLLVDGIGDTIRVSLTVDPVEEVLAAKDILVSLGLKKGVRFVSCPKCGRCGVDLENTAAAVYDYVKAIDADLKIAVMGCEVNGPGECKDADIGMAGANGMFVFFKKGEVYKRVPSKNAVEEFKKEIDLLTNDNRVDTQKIS